MNECTKILKECVEEEKIAKRRKESKEEDVVLKNEVEGNSKKKYHKDRWG